MNDEELAQLNQAEKEEMTEARNVCDWCGATMPLNTPKCPECGKDPNSGEPMTIVKLTEEQMMEIFQANCINRMMDLILELTPEYLREVIREIHSAEWHPDPVVNEKVKDRALKRMQAIIDFKYAVELVIPELENGDNSDSDKKV